MQTFVINCSRKQHIIIVNEKGQLIFKNHALKDLETEIALMQLGANKICKCAKILYQLRHPLEQVDIYFSKKETAIRDFVYQKQLLARERKFEKNIEATLALPKERLKIKICDKIKKIIRDLIFKQSIYRFAENRWVNSENTVTIINSKILNIKQNSWRVWSRNGKWSGNSTEITVSVPFVHWYNHVYKKGLALVDGVFVLDIIEETPNYYIVIAGKKGRGFTITPCKAKINKTNNSLKWLKQV